MLNKHFVEEQFLRHANSPRAWELSAITLRYGAEVLYRQVRADLAVNFMHRRRKALRPSLYGTCLMLFGLVIEDLAKGAIVHRGTPLDATGRVAFRDHKLVNLVRRAGLHPSEEDLSCLKDLQGYVEWAGRYPIPRHRSSYRIGLTAIGKDVRVARAIAERLESLLPTKPLRVGTRLPSSRVMVWRRSG